MRRKLTTEEIKLEKLGLEMNKKELDALNYSFLYNQALINKQKYLRDFEDKWREPERLRKDSEDEQVLKTIQNEIEMKKNIIKIAEEHLGNGVEIKENKIAA